MVGAKEKAPDCAGACIQGSAVAGIGRFAFRIAALILPRAVAQHQVAPRQLHALV